MTGRGGWERLHFGAVVLACALVGGPAVARAQGPDPVAESGEGFDPTPPTVTTWEEALLREATVPPPPARVSRPSISDYIVRMEFENPQEIIAARKRIEEFEQQARDALARGVAPPVFWQPYDPAIDLTDLAPPDPEAEIAWSDQAPAPEDGTRAGGRAVTDTWRGLEDTSRPSDSVLAVGLNHVGVMVNKKLAFYTKDGALARGPVRFTNWWSNAPVSRLYDPKIVYDVHENRWIMLVLSGVGSHPETYFAVSVSQTSDPTGSWWTWYLRSDKNGSTDTDLWADYPGLGYDSGNATSSTTTGGAVYITSNQYTSGGSFQYARVRRLKKYQLYTGSSVGWHDKWNLKNENGWTVFTIKPAQTYTATSNPPIGYFMNTSSGGASWITMWKMTNPLSSSPTLTRTKINTNSYSVPPRAKQSGGGSSYFIDTNDCRTQDVQYRGGYLYMSCGDAADYGTPSNVEAVMHIFKVKATNISDKPWDHRLGKDNYYYHYPNIQARADGKGILGFSRSGANIYSQVRAATVPLSVTGWQSALVKSGEATYNPSGDATERWGDYNGVGIEPNGTQNGAFVMSQIAISSSRWQTWIGAVDVSTPVYGACCQVDGDCTRETQADCQAAGNTYQGDDTTCSPNPCTPIVPGDSCANPLVINIPDDLPYNANDTTCGREDDYNATCMALYDGGEDIIYKLNVTETICLNILLDADTTWAGMAVDNACPPDQDCVEDATSNADPDEINDLQLTPGTYYLMVDTWPSPDCAAFSLDISECPCIVACPAGSTAEGETDCTDDSTDTYNGGCNSTPPVFSSITCGETVCGKSGTFVRNIVDKIRDTDWYEVTINGHREYTITVEAEFEVVFGLAPTDPQGTGDCADVRGVVSPAVLADHCEPRSVTTSCLPPGTYWFFVAPQGREGVPCDAKYTATLTCVDCDHCPGDPNKLDPGRCGCGVPETDTDGDGTPDCDDGCMIDPNKTRGGVCGCGAPDTDSDGDGTPNCRDSCPNDRRKTSPGACGCGAADTDGDRDGTPDCGDGCPDDAGKVSPGACGCGNSDADTNGNGTPDCLDGGAGQPAPEVPCGGGGCGAGVAGAALLGFWVLYAGKLVRRRRQKRA